MNINFINTKTGHTKLVVEHDKYFEFDSGFNPKESIGKLTIKQKDWDEEVEIDIYSIEEKDGKIIVNDYMHISK